MAENTPELSRHEAQELLCMYGCLFLVSLAGSAGLAYLAYETWATNPLLAVATGMIAFATLVVGGAISKSHIKRATLALQYYDQRS